MILIKGTPETKATHESEYHFDVRGLILFVLMMLSINIVITQSGTFGILSPIILSLILMFLVTTFLFIQVEKHQDSPLIDFKLFQSKSYTGATLSNFLLNGVAGTLLVSNTFVQQGLGFNGTQAGMLSITYLVTVLTMIRVGEKVLQHVGPRKPMLIGAVSNMMGVILISFTFLPSTMYVIVCVIGYLLYGFGLGFYATPSTDTAIANSPYDKAGAASGIYKMASSLGGAFGIALSGAVYSAVTTATNIQVGAMAGLGLNVVLGLLAFVIIFITIPKSEKHV